MQEKSISMMSEEDFIKAMKKSEFIIERIEPDYGIEDNLTDEDIYKLICSVFPFKKLSNETHIKNFVKKYKVINLIDILYIYIDYNDLGLKYGLMKTYKVLKGGADSDKMLFNIINDFYSNPFKLNEMYFLVKENF